MNFTRVKITCGERSVERIGEYCSGCRVSRLLSECVLPSIAMAHDAALQFNVFGFELSGLVTRDELLIGIEIDKIPLIALGAVFRGNEPSGVVWRKLLMVRDEFLDQFGQAESAAAPEPPPPWGGSAFLPAILRAPRDVVRSALDLESHIISTFLLDVMEDGEDAQGTAN